MSAALKKAKDRVKSLKATLRVAENYVKKELTKLKTKKPSTKLAKKTSSKLAAKKTTARKNMTLRKKPTGMRKMSAKSKK